MANQQQPNQIFELLKSLLQTSQSQAGQMQGTQSEIQSNEQRMGKPQQNAYQKGVDKALNESGYAHASEAILKGADPMMVAQQSSQMGAQQSMNNVAPLLQTLLSMAQPQQQQQTSPQQQMLDPIQQQAQEQISSPKSMMGKVFDSLGFAEPVRSAKLDNLAKAQKIMGQEPWQSGDIEKTRYEKSMALETSKINKALEMDKLDITRASSYLDKISELPKFSGDELTKYTALQEMYDASLQLSKRLEKDPNALVTLGLPNDQYGQQTLLWANKIAANRKFFQGGTALTPMENKTLESILAKRGLGAVMQNPKVAKEAIDSISDKARKVFSKMDVYADDREFINEARAMGYNDVSVMKALYKRRSSTKGK